MRRGLVCIGLVATLLLSGCKGGGLPVAREMGDMALLRTMGVDMESDVMDVTVSTGRRAKGLSGAEEAPLILRARRGTLSGACQDIQGLSDSYVFYGYVDQLLLGESLATVGVDDVLDYFARDVELGLGTQVWLVRGDTAENAIYAGGNTGVDTRLSTLLTNSEMEEAGMTRTAGETLTSLLEDNAAYLPALSTRAGVGGETALVEVGYGVLKDSKLTGWLDGESARGLELLEGQVAADIIEVELEGGIAAVVITDATLIVVPQTEHGTLIGVELFCRVRGDLDQVPHPLSHEELERVEQEVERNEQVRINMALAQLQLWGADCISLGRKIGMAEPSLWSDLEENWDGIFSSLPLTTRVSVTIDRAYSALE